jgi:hypothetical protein
MNRRLGLWVSGVGALLATALIAAPIWDLWRYRTLRAPIGPHVAVGVILPLRPAPAAAPVPLAAREETAAAASTTATPAPAVPASAPRSASPASLVPQVAAVSPAPALVAPAASGDGASSHKVFPAPRPIPNTAPARAPAAAGEVRAADTKPLNEKSANEDSADQADKTAPPADSAAPDSGMAIPVLGWVAPAQDEGPQVPPEPQPGPPTPVPPAPQPRIRDPRPAPTVIPILTLAAPATPIAVGSSFTVTVRLSGGQNITSLPFHLEFDPSILQFQFAQRGPALGSKSAILLASVNPARPGDLAVGLSLVESGSLLQGSGTVLSLQFLALAPGSSPLDFSRSSVRGSMSETLDAQFHGARVDVR